MQPSPFHSHKADAQQGVNLYKVTLLGVAEICCTAVTAYGLVAFRDNVRPGKPLHNHLIAL